MKRRGFLKGFCKAAAVVVIAPVIVVNAVSVSTAPAPGLSGKVFMVKFNSRCYWINMQELIAMEEWKAKEEAEMFRTFSPLRANSICSSSMGT